ncbi:MAG: hypothetical protein WCA20_00085 [Candidatus Sulfotelmatobacter sp.]
MTITAHTETSNEYRRRAHELICRVQPGKIVVHVFGLYSLAEVEEYIEALKSAAKEAQLPAEREKGQTD